MKKNRCQSSIGTYNDWRSFLKRYARKQPPLIKNLIVSKKSGETYQSAAFEKVKVLAISILKNKINMIMFVFISCFLQPLQ